MIKLGSNTISNIFLGNNQINAVYQGSNLIWQPYEPEIVAWSQANGITNQAVLSSFNSFVLSLKANSLWTSAIGIYYMYNSFNESKYNLVNPAQTLTQVGSGTFSNGYIRNAITDYLQMPHNGNSNSGNLTAGIVAKNDSDGNLGVALGITEGTNQTFIVPRWTLIPGYLAKAGGMQLSGANLDATGIWFMTQKVSATSEVSVYKNGAQLGTTSSTPTAATGAWLIGNGGSTANNAITSRLWLGLLFNNLTFSQVSILNDLVGSLLSLSSIDFAGKTIEFYGDSIVAGSAASPSSNRWTSLFCANKGATESNSGISGEVLQNGTVCGRTVFDQTTIATYNSLTHGALFISLGTNDIGLNNGTMTSAGYNSTLSSVVDYAHTTKGWPLSKIVLCSPPYMTTTGYNLYVGSCSVAVAADAVRHRDYVAQVLSVAQTKHTCYVDFYTAMVNYATPSDLISGDGVHPNNIGHSFMATTAENNGFLTF